MANAVLFATPPALLLPQAVEFSYLTTDAEFIHLDSARVFSSLALPRSPDIDCLMSPEGSPRHARPIPPGSIEIGPSHYRRTRRLRVRKKCSHQQLYRRIGTMPHCHCRLSDGAGAAGAQPRYSSASLRRLLLADAGSSRLHQRPREMAPPYFLRSRSPRPALRRRRAVPATRVTTGERRNTPTPPGRPSSR